MRNLKTSLLVDTDNLTSINTPNWQYCSRRLFWSSLWETREPQVNGLCFVNWYLKKSFFKILHHIEKYVWSP